MSSPDLGTLLAALQPMVTRPIKTDPDVPALDANASAKPGVPVLIEGDPPRVKVKQTPRPSPDASTVADVKIVGGRVLVTMNPRRASAAKVPDVLAAAVKLADGATVDVSHRGAIVASTDPARISKPKMAPVDSRRPVAGKGG